MTILEQMTSAKNNSKIKKISRIFIIVSDVLAVTLPASLIYTFSDINYNTHHFRTMTLIGILAFVASILFWSQTLYEQYTVRRSFYDEFKELLQIYLFNGLAALSALFIFDLSTEREKHIIFLTSVFILMPLLRYSVRFLLDKINLWRIDSLIFCPHSEFQYAKAAIESQFNLGMHIRHSRLENRLVIKLINEIEFTEGDKYGLIQKKIIEFHKKIGSPHIIVFSHRKNANYVPKIIELITLCGLPYSIIPDIGGASLLGMRVSHFFRWELLLITPQNNLDRISYRLLKRILDIILSSIFILIMSIPMLIIYLIVRRDGGPGIFAHKRLGFRGEKFQCYKFRSMKVDSERLLAELLRNEPHVEKEWKENHKLANDPRTTRIGKFLRETSLDELPQLFNVLIGNMSLVGPRPIVESEVPKYSKSIELYYKVRPGLTGLWQISGRSNTSYDYRVSLDIWYIKNWSVWYDIGILIKTIGIVLMKKGAY
jgi:Undecaprenyl-phosphate galactose phosphotransferase WbaP